MKCWICVVVIASFDVCIYVKDVGSTPCECLCTGDSSNGNGVELTVSGDYCKPAGTLAKANIDKCTASCDDKTWRVEDENPLCVCNNSTNVNSLCKQCTGSPQVTCVCNSTNRIVEIPAMVTTTSVTVNQSITSTSRYSQNFSMMNTTTIMPKESKPRKYSPVGVGLGVVFGLAIIIAIVFLMIFLYRRHQQDIENQSKTPEVPVYAATQEDDTRWTSRGSLDNPTYNKDHATIKGSALPHDSSQDSSTHYTCLELNDRGMSNGGYSDAENYTKPLNGHSTSGELDDDHEYQGLYTEVATPDSTVRKTIQKTDDSDEDYPDDCITPSSSIGDHLQPDTKLASTGFDTDSSDPYYTILTRGDSDDRSPCLIVPSGVPGIGKYNGSTSGDSGDYEQLNLNRDEGPPQLSLAHEDVDDETGEGAYGIMVEIEEQLEDGNDDSPPLDEFYDHLDRGPVGNVAIRPLG